MGRWPDPGDSAIDRARAIAYSYRVALIEVAPGRAEVLDSAAVALGELWVVPQLASVAPGELVSTAMASGLLGVDPATLRSWSSRPHIPVSRRQGGWDLEELVAYQASQRQRRRGHR